MLKDWPCVELEACTAAYRNSCQQPDITCSIDSGSFDVCSTLCTLLQIAGLDVGWGQRLDLQLDQNTQTFTIERELPVGKFGYKFILDDRWTYSADHPTFLDGDNINNYIEVMGNTTDPKLRAARDRILSEEGQMTDAERQDINNKLKHSNSGL